MNPLKSKTMNIDLIDSQSQSIVEINEEQEKFDITTFAEIKRSNEYLYNIWNFLLENPAFDYSENFPVETTFNYYMGEESENLSIEEEDDNSEDYDIDFHPKNPKIRMKVRIRSVREYEPKIKI